ncbi:MAG: hypothetical protein GF398_09360 [Chitinivibrionales bacterium]|nr:hypothetical protein [Chitinivibrionales bacterium]
MRTMFRVAVSLSALMLLFSCTTRNLESRGNAAYAKAQKATGDEKRRLEKEAYTYYWKAVKSDPNKATIRNSLRNRFIEMTLNRGMLILNEATSSMDALDLFVSDIDSVMTPEVPGELKAQYAAFLTQLADSMDARGKMWETIELLDKAGGIAPDASAMKDKKKTLIGNFVNSKVDLAKMQLEEGRDAKDEHEQIRAEYNAKLALFFDPDNEEAKEILSKCYEANLGIYSAYDAVIEDKPDSSVYDMVNKYDILLAVPVVKQSGRGVTLKASIYNYSYNPLRLWPKCFHLEDVNGKRVQARKNSRIAKEVLDQEHEVTGMLLYFPKPPGKIKKLTYDYKWEHSEHYSEKNFF